MSVSRESRPYAAIVDALKEASRAAADLRIDLFKTGQQREIILADHLGHELCTSLENPLIDAVDSKGRFYAYSAAHVGKRPQIFLSRRAPRGQVKKGRGAWPIHAFIIGFFSADDACKIVSIWQCNPTAVWREIEKQASQKKIRNAPTQSAYFSEALLRKWAHSLPNTLPEAEQIFPVREPRSPPVAESI